jgi:hypothetical protein
MTTSPALLIALKTHIDIAVVNAGQWLASAFKLKVYKYQNRVGETK